MRSENIKYEESLERSHKRNVDAAPLRDCPSCGKEFRAFPKNKKYCDISCYRKDKGVWHRSYEGKGISSGTVGAIAELRVSADLMARGYEVYRALSPSSSCDILVRKKDSKKNFGVEIRTGYRNPADSRLIYPTQNIRAEIIAVFIHITGEIIYMPDISKNDHAAT